MNSKRCNKCKWCSYCIVSIVFFEIKKKSILYICVLPQINKTTKAKKIQNELHAVFKCSPGKEGF